MGKHNNNNEKKYHEKQQLVDCADCGYESKKMTYCRCCGKPICNGCSKKNGGFCSVCTDK